MPRALKSRMPQPEFPATWPATSASSAVKSSSSARKERLGREDCSYTNNAPIKALQEIKQHNKYASMLPGVAYLATSTIDLRVVSSTGCWQLKPLPRGEIFTFVKWTRGGQEIRLRPTLALSAKRTQSKALGKKPQLQGSEGPTTHP